MQVFIENEEGSYTKHIYDENNLTLLDTMQVARPYPYPYGFIVGTMAPDGDHVDVFIITDQDLRSGQIVECTSIGLMEQFEYSWNPETPELLEEDHNVIAILTSLKDDRLTRDIQQKLTDFVTHVFDHVRKNKTRVGRFLSNDAATSYILRCTK